MNPKEIERHELIGLTCKVIDSRNKDLIGLQGKIINETRNTIKIEHKNKIKTILKSEVTLEFIIKNKSIQIKGEKLLKRSEERIKDETN